MAEERTLGTARATETDTVADDELTKAELQRRMDEARESITQTVSEIKDTVTTQYQNVRESISQSLDWREQYRRRPVEFTIAALGVGLLVGYSVGGAFGGAYGSTAYSQPQQSQSTATRSSSSGSGSRDEQYTAAAPAAAFADSRPSY